MDTEKGDKLVECDYGWGRPERISPWNLPVAPFLLFDHQLLFMDGRFIQELEFVQGLGNPDYLLHLLCEYEQDADFWRFLEHLRQTWNEPAYRRFITFPLGLFVLDLLLAKDSEGKKLDGDLQRDPVSVVRLLKAQIHAQGEYLRQLHQQTI